MHPTNTTLQNLKNYNPRIDLLQDKLVVITGATGGIGRELSKSCVEHGAQLLLVAKNEAKLNSLLQELSNQSKFEHYSYVIDFSIAGEIDYIKFAEFIAALNKPLDSVILNAGYIEALQGLRNYELETWLKTITINQHAPFLITRCCIPSLELADDPTIVFSTHDCNRAYWGAYGVAKQAQLGLMKILADELDGDKPIRVNGIDPAPVSTKLRTAQFPGINPNNYLSPHDIISAYLYFIGPDSKGITGYNYKLSTHYKG